MAYAGTRAHEDRIGPRCDGGLHRFESAGVDSSHLCGLDGFGVSDRLVGFTSSAGADVLRTFHSTQPCRPAYQAHPPVLYPLP